MIMGYKNILLRLTLVLFLAITLCHPAVAVDNLNDDIISLYSDEVNVSQTNGSLSPHNDTYENISSFYLAGNYAQSLEVSKRILDSNPNSTYALYMAGLNLEKLARENEAIQYYEKALLNLMDTDNQNITELVNNPDLEALPILFLKGKISHLEGNYNDSLTYQDAALSAYGYHSEDLYNKGLYHKNEGNYGDAIEHFQAALRINPSKTDAWLQLGECYEAIEEYQKAQDNYEKALQMNPNDSELLLKYGLVAEKMDDHSLAIEYYDRVLEIQPYNVDAWRYKACGLEALGQNYYALTCYNQALEYDPENKTLWNLKGQLLDKMGRYEESIECYDKALKLNPEHARGIGRVSEAPSIIIENDSNEVFYETPQFNSEAAQILFNKGEAFYRLEKYEDALECYNDVLETEPHAVVWYRKATILKNNGDFK